jgi:glutamyl-tRNA synthetase
MTVITRFAPSPTGLLHVGNLRTALINYLFAKKCGGTFMLRMDDTDRVRSKEEYADAIKEDLNLAGLHWDIYANQASRLARYEEIKQLLLAQGRLYPCFESQEELEIKRKFQLTRGAAPIYDRAALKLTAEQKAKYESEGKKPHFRFKLNDETIKWNDLVRGDISFEGKHLSDPILIREDGTMTYILSSVVDDIDFKITHIIRGEDHISNTAIQIQIFNCLDAVPPIFAHLSMIKTKDAEISKRTGGFDIKSLREEGIEAMAINSLFAKIGTSDAIEPKTTLAELVAEFDIKKFGKAPASYDKEDLTRLNRKLISIMPYQIAKPRLTNVGLLDIDEGFWISVRSNITTISEIKEWWEICKAPLTPIIEDEELLELAGSCFPNGELTGDSWSEWINAIQKITNKKGKQLFMPLRKAITARERGPELKKLLPLIGREKILLRLQGKTA